MTNRLLNPLARVFTRLAVTFLFVALLSPASLAVGAEPCLICAPDPVNEDDESAPEVKVRDRGDLAVRHRPAGPRTPPAAGVRRAADSPARSVAVGQPAGAPLPCLPLRC